MNKKAKIITLIVLLTFIVVSLISFMIFAITKNTFNFGSMVINQTTSKNLTHEEVYENTFNEINIKSDSADIEIKESSDDKVKVLIYSDEEDEKVDINNDTNLNINLSNNIKISFFKFNNKNSKIELYVPTNYDKKITIESDYGNINIADFNNLNLDIESDCGDIKIEGANNLKLKSSYGDSIIRQVNKVNIVSDCGDVKINNANSVKIENSFGDTEIKNVTEYVNITSDCGDIEIGNMTLVRNSKIKSDLGDVSIEKISNVFIDATVDLGEIDIKNNDRQSNITLTIENNCGDIEVN